MQISKQMAETFLGITPTYEWTITRDLISRKDERSRVGVCGPRTCTRDHAAITADPKGKRFRMLDDDGNCYYEGVIVGEQDGFEPLEDFGTPDAGCVIIEYREDGQWVGL